MKNLIIPALNDAMIKLEKQVPQTKIKVVQVDISDVNPLELLSFMQKNNIPDDAYFDTTYNETAVFSSGAEPCLSYQIDVPTNEKEKLAFKKKRFTSVAWSMVYNALTSNGFKRVGFNSGLLRDFDDTTVYEMYLAQDFDRLEKYYLLPFERL